MRLRGSVLGGGRVLDGLLVVRPCGVAQWREWHDEGGLLVSKGHRGHGPMVATIRIE